MSVIKLVNWSYNAPLSIHLLITSRCNLNCKGCYYRHAEAEVPFLTVKRLFQEWQTCGVKSVALGGGEPLLHPHIEDIVKLGRRMGFYVAVTTNGTVLKDVRPDRLHISCDELHPTDRKTVEKAVRYYRQRAGRLGINHVVKSLEGVLELESLDVDTIMLLLEKPKSQFTGWEDLFKLKLSKQVWYDACLSRFFSWIKCRQGLTSMSINPSLEASACSNLKTRVSYTNLIETWRKVRSLACKFTRDFD